MYSPPHFLSPVVLAEVLAERAWPGPYRLDKYLPDGIAVVLPKCTLFFEEGFERVSGARPLARASRARENAQKAYGAPCYACDPTDRSASSPGGA